MLDEWLFLASSLVLLVAGTNLARYAEAIAEKTHVSVAWVGLFLVAAVTSLPELVTGLSSIVVVDEPDLAAGDVLGSCLVNLSLAAVAALAARGLVTERADARVYAVGSAYVTAMLAIVAGGMAAHLAWGARRSLGIASVLLVVAYFVAIRHVFHVQARPGAPPSKFASLSGRRVAALYGLNGAVVVAAATALPWLGQRIALARGLEASFVGTALLAGATSLPELVVVVAALRRGVPSLAVGGLVGSNLFDLVILALDDLFYLKGPLLAAIDADHLPTVGLIAVSTWLLVSALPAGRRPRRPALVGVLVAHALALTLAARGLAQG